MNSGFLRILPHLQKVIPDGPSRLLKGWIFSNKHFKAKIHKRTVILPAELEALKEFVVMFGHSDFTKSSGGTERVILEQTESLIAQNKNCLFVYPRGPSVLLNFLKPPTYVVLLNGFEICTISKSELFGFLSAVQAKATELRIHHLLFWPLEDVVKSVETFNSKSIPIVIYTHDFYFHCPKVNAFCKSGSKVCEIHFGKKVVRVWRARYQRLFEIAQCIIAPSEFMSRQLPAEFFPKTRVETPYNPPEIRSEKLKLAFLGYAAPIKGAETWLNLAQNALITRSYDLIHIGAGGDAEFPIQKVAYSFHSSKDCEASKLLQDFKVDFVLLWSQVPESFSFTYHEAQKAGKFVITNEKSGNIAHLLRQNEKNGIVLSSEYELVQFLLRRSLI